MRCRSWRPRGRLAHQGKIGNRRTWMRCHNKVVAPFRRCRECFTILSTHPDPQVRLFLAHEAILPHDVADLLASDPEESVKEAFFAVTHDLYPYDYDVEASNPWSSKS